MKEAYCQTNPLKAIEEPIICLLCGEVICCGECCKRDGKGAASRHAVICNAGVGILLFVKTMSIVIMF